jgi:hypothetical protein
MVACTATTGGVALPAEALAPLKEGFQQSCDALRETDAAAFEKAIAACKDTACGAGGGEYLTCVSTKTGGM